MHKRKEFLDRMYAMCEGCLELRAITPGLPFERFFAELVAHEDIDYFCEYYKKQNIYFGVGTRDATGSGAKENVIHIPALWADIDFKSTPKLEVKTRLDAFTFKPSVFILTGHGLHLYWLLREPSCKDEFGLIEDLLRRIRQHFDADPNACEVARILRMPGTMNVKADPVKCKLYRIDDFTYNLEDFTDLPEAETPAGPSSNYTRPPLPSWVKECEFIRWCRDNQSEVKEPAWYAMISNLLTIRPGGVELCHEYSKDHPKYKRTETDKKILHALNHGPHSCAHINAQGVGGGNFKCAKLCGVKSPCVLGFTKKDKGRNADESRIKPKKFSFS